MMKFVLSTSAGLEKIAKIEVIKQWWKIIEVVDRLITFEGTMEIAANVALWSRVGNKVFMLLAEEEGIEDFDDLYGLVNMVDFPKLILYPQWERPQAHLIKEGSSFPPIIVKATSLRSELSSTPTIQSISKKALIDTLLKITGWVSVFEDDAKPKFEILVLFINNKARILLNITWDALHKRGYREEAWEAPLKESLAAGLVLLSAWKFKEPLYDVFCGSGTIAIEAAMLAKNIAPWLKRDFSMVDLGLIKRDTMKELKAQAREKQYSWKYKIYATDIDSEVLWLAQKNADNAGVWEDIIFEKKDFRSYENISGTLVTNPPYWLRLTDSDIPLLYKDIDQIFRKNSDLWGGFISNYLEFDDIAQKDFYKKRKLYNGAEKCYFWKKK